MKHYTVFSGIKPGVYPNWDECRANVHGVRGAIFKSYPDEKTAQMELQKFQKNAGRSGAAAINHPRPSIGICSDASFSQKTKLLEYRVVDIETGEVLAHRAWPNVCNDYMTNIGEFFALVRAIKCHIDGGLNVPIYCDSVTAIKWATERKVKTKCGDPEFIKRLAAGVNYLKSINPPFVTKWQTDLWGEIPADFGRK